ncbi:MAG: hypothetical protein QOJ89_5303 [bacterium]|jgi:hypothetical protein
MPHAPSADESVPARRDVKITVFATIGVDDPPPDCLEALRRLMVEHPDRVTVYDVTDVGAPPPADPDGAVALDEGCVVEIPEPTAQSVTGRAPVHRAHVLAARERMTAPLTITGTDGADKIVVSDRHGETTWLFVTDVRPATAPSP